MATIKPVTVPSKRLSTSISASDTSFKLNNILGWDGVNLSSASFGTKLYCVFRNSAGTLMELMEIDPTTITSATAAITILQRGLNFNGDYTTPVTANKLSWVKGDTIVELGTHIPQLLAHYVDNLADQSIDGIKTFLKTPASSGGNPVNTTDLVTKAYADALVLGTLTTLDIIVPGTADATITAGQIVYLKTSNGRWALASAAAAATSENVLLGIAQGAGAAAGAITNGVLLQGADALQSGLVAGTVMYLSDTPGAIGTTTGTKTVVVGLAKDATHLYFDPRFDQQLTQDLINALAGDAGTPSGTNKFLTQQSNLSPAGSVIAFAGSSAPTGWLLCNGAAVSRTTYAALFAVIGTTYGIGDGSTTFNVPDSRSRTIIGVGTGTKVFTFASRASNTITVTGAANSTTNDLQTGQAVLYHSATTVMTGLTNDTTYYLIRIAYNQFQLSATLAGAIDNTGAITLSSDGAGAQTFTVTLAARALADTGGEETHGLVTAELAAHTHAVNFYTSGSNTHPAQQAGAATATPVNNLMPPTDAAGGDTPHNNMPVFISMNYIIKT